MLIESIQDAIVTSTNDRFSGSDGVDYAVHQAAGQELDQFLADQSQGKDVTLSTTEKVLFKDKENINHRNIDEYLSNIELLAGTLRDPNGIDVTTSLLWNSSCISFKEHKKNHSGCEPFGVKDSVTRLTEKRMCKCMYYYGKEPDMCAECKIDSKWKNVGNIEIIECEVPTRYVIDTVGGIDLILKDSSGNIYSTEVKPQGSSETLVRMMAEAFTFMAVGGPEEYTACIPAICFFKNSRQYEDFLNPEIQNSTAFQYLLTRIKVFYITADQKKGLIEFVIHDNDIEPIIN